MPGRSKATAGGSAIVRTIEPSILTIRGLKVLLDRDLAAIYGVSV